MATRAYRNRVTIVAAALFVLVFAWSAGGAERSALEARRILEATGVQGGLIVHLGCGQGKLTAALRANASYLVHGLDADAKHVEAARKYLQSLGLCGSVSVEVWNSPRLPYNDNLVNLLVAEELGGVPPEEVLRVLAPNGVAYLRQGGQWSKRVKPRPAEIDEWTHYLHDPSNNAVAHDSVVGPPRRMQWIGGPRYSRHHDHMSSVSAMVSSGGRNFYIFDEATRASILVPPKWSLVARDAFNGVVLWKRPIEEWQSHLWPLKSGPQLLTRRLVALGERVYTTLGLSAPLTALQAATGATLRTYEGTAATEEILLSQGVLFVVVNPRLEPKFASLQAAREAASQAWPDEGQRRILALEADSGKALWAKETRILPETLTVEGSRVLYHDGEKIVCLNRADGARIWASPPLAHKSIIVSYFTPTLVAYKDVVLFSGGIDGSDYGGGKSPVIGLSARDGKILWTAEQPPCGHHTPKDLLVANGLVWYGEVALPTDSGEMTALDPLTGRIAKQFLPDSHVPWFHHRCYRAKATDNYLLFSRTGIEFIDTSTNHWTPNNWVRGGCLYGIMPCNGLVYAPPHPCACYTEAKLYGFTALAPESKTPPGAAAPEETRLVRGPAWEERGQGAEKRGQGKKNEQPRVGSSNPQSPIPNPHFPIPNPDDWPTYRHDAARSGSTAATVPTALKGLWQANLGGRLSSVVIAGGKLFVSSLDTDTVHALDAGTGQAVWSFVAGGRVDSPPTIWQGRALFGCSDGYVYCLRAADGTLAWRYLAAPEDRRMVAFDQVESVWPVPGSVLVQEGVVYCVAGRSMFLDGGLRLLRLDPQTGKKLSETVLDDRDPETQENLQSHATGMNMPVALPDILSSDGRYVYMRSLPFDLDGKRKFIDVVKVKDQKGDDAHLFSPTGFLDDTMWHRTYWVFGRAWASGAGGYYQAGWNAPAGRLMVFDDTTIWGYGRRWQYFRWSTPYVNHLFAASKQPEILTMTNPPPSQPKSKPKKKGTLSQMPPTRFATRWSDDLPVQACALVHAGPTLWVAGPQSFVNEEEAAKSLDDPQIQAKVVEQGAAFDGHKGAILAAVSAADGKALATCRLASLPVFDGMAAAGGRIYLSTTDGKVLCLGAGEGTPLESADDVLVTPRSPDEEKPLSTQAAAAAGPSKPETRTHRDFQHLASVNVADCPLGYRIEAVDKKKSGVALKKLASPLARQATFKLKLQPLAETGRLENL